jgi:hypothetical protein
MVQTGSYDELLENSSAFSRLLENIHQQKEEENDKDSMLPVHRKQSTSSRIDSMGDNISDVSTSSDNDESKGQGSVNVEVYFGYLRAGIQLVVGSTLLILVFSIREGTFIIFSRWLAEWSDDETLRHRNISNCSKGMNDKVDRIRSMSEVEWNKHRLYRFYTFCGRKLSNTYYFTRFQM